MLFYQFVFILCIYINCDALSYVSAQVHKSNGNEYEKINNILPAYAIALRADLINSTICKEELRDFRDAINQRILWSLKMLDSSGGYKPGFFYGNNFWLGSRSQCLDLMNTVPLLLAERHILNNTIYRDPQKEFPPFKVNYYVAHFKHNSTLQYHINWANEDLITLGLCLPASCSINDLNLILEKMVHDRVFFINDLYSMDFKLIDVKNLKDDQQWLFNSSHIILFSALLLTFCMMVIGTIYDIFVHQKYLNIKNKSDIKSILKKERERNREIELGEMGKASALFQESRIWKIVMCFSVYTNTGIIFNTKLNANAISSIYGLKFLSMCWIIFIHTIFFIMDYIDNKGFAWKILPDFIFRMLINIIVPVDTFFFSSGFLLTYLYLKDKMGTKQTTSINYKAKLSDFFIRVIKRFIRLTPAYMIMLGILQLNSTWYNKTSQLYSSFESHEVCAKYWWRNLLYINNLFDINGNCMAWSWYLANDMQFFIIATVILILSTMYFYMAAVILSVLLIGSIALTSYISYINKYVPTLDEQYRLADILYYVPWVRIGPYIIGIITGYIIRRLNKKLALNKMAVIVCWCLASACNGFILLGLNGRNVSVTYAAFYVAISRIFWAIGIAWIVIACVTKHGGIVNKILSFKCWIPLSKLTYCAYLVNPFIIESFYLSSEASNHLQFLPVIITCIGYFVISYVCAYVLSLMAEIPYILLMQMFLKSKKKRTENVYGM